MPRRKQDCPKRMKWEEGASGEHGKDGGEYRSDVTDGTTDINVSSSKKRGSDEEDEEESSTAEEEDDSNTGNKRVRLARSNSNGSSVAVTDNNNKVTVSVVDKDNDNMTVTEEGNCEGGEDDEEHHRHQENNIKPENDVYTARTVKEVTYRQVLTPTPPVASQSPIICVPLQLQTTPLPLSVDEQPRQQQRHQTSSKKETEAEEMAHSSENDETQDSPLDFSVKRKTASPKPSTPLKEETTIQSDVDAPLDLSFTSSRKRPLENNTSGHHHHHVGILQHVNAHLSHVVGNRNKSLRLDNSGSSGGGGKTSSPWSNQFPFRFSPSSSPNSSVEIPLWNGGVKTSGASVSGGGAAGGGGGGGGSRSTPSPSNSNEISQRNHTIQRDPSPKTSSTNATSSGRHNAWQSHWLSRGAEQAKDVLKCVWCRKSFRSLEEMTTHMKEARHCGMHLHHQTSLPPPLPPPPPPSSQQLQQQQQQQMAKNSSGNQQKKLNGDDVSKDSSGGGTTTSTSLPMPRKLVRGQDVWLGKGAEQTKQILKCMWCGQSFKSLAEMTTHMQQTQHYTNIISQEQIISWKSPEDRMTPTGQSHVNAVLTCKVCDQAFSSLKELSNHMVKNSHYKEHILRSITENGGRRRQTREKRKKSLPVRKLLELERAQNEVNRIQQQTPVSTPDVEHNRISAKSVNSTSSSTSASNETTGKISCEKCGRKIDTQQFVEHIRQCVGNGGGSTMATSGSISSLSTLIASVSPKSDKRSSSPRKSDMTSSSSPRQSHKHNYTSPILQPSPTSSSESNGQLMDSVLASHNNSSGSEAPSVLNAIERLIEKSFDGKQQANRSRHYVTNTPGSNRTTPSSSSTPAPIVQPLSDVLKPDDDDEHRKDNKSGSESESYVDEEEEEVGYDKLIIDETGPGKAEMVAQKYKRNKLRRRSSSSVNRLSSPFDVGSVDVQRVSGSASSVRASPLSTSSRRDVCSPVRSVDSPGSCSNCSSNHTGTIERGGSAGGNSNVAASALSLVRSTPSPSSPTDHPLRELQKLLDKTNVSLTKSSNSASVVRESLSPSASVAIGQALSPGSSASGLLSYASGGWGESSLATSNVTGSDSVIHCNFCDNSFVSRSAFRHHMAKVHAIPAKDGSRLMTSSASSLTVTALNMSTSGCVRISSPSASSSSSTSSSSANSPSSNNVNNNNNNNNNNLCKSPAKNNLTSSTTSSLSSATSTANASTAPAPDESPHSKFLKYTELAKQLSSKYV
ncbi:hypothetical protein CHUAL_003831 [Chamberlinius hualienensis]